MNKILTVAKREYIETVKTKAFIWGVVIAPFLMAIIIFFVSSSLINKVGPRPPIKLTITDLSGSLFTEVKTLIDEHNSSNQKRPIQLETADPNKISDANIIESQKSRLRRGEINVYMVLDANIIDGEGKMHLYSCEMKSADIEVLWTIESIINQAAVKERCRIKNVSPELLAELRRNVPSEQVELSQAGSKESIQSQNQRMTQMMIPFFFMYLMFLGMIIAGQQMLSSIIEEKSSRVIEVLLASLSPFELMAGKIFGLGAVGLTMLLLWGLPAYSVAIYQGIKVDISIGLLIYFLIYYLMGFVLYSSILAGIGSLCNTVKESQSLMGPLTMVFVFPIIVWYNLVRDPEGILARVLSFIPPMTPMVMVLRLSASEKLPFIEILATILLLAASIPLVIWVAAKIFRTGILMYGKKPGIKEIFRWLKQK
jgi:ABC-2 type transport system permease protein